MKRILFIAVIFISVLSLKASDWVGIQSDNPISAQFTLLNSNIQNSTVQFTLEGFWKNEVETEKGSAWLIYTDKGGSILKKGAPDLPCFATSLIIPDQSAMKVTIVSAEYKEIKNVLIAPSKGNLTRDIDPASVPFEFGKYYNTDKNYPGAISRLDDPYIVRDYRGQALIIQPFQYNPVTKTLKVYYNITVKVSENGTSSNNTINRSEPLTKINSQFKHIYQRQFLNFNSGSRYEPVEEDGNMIIISYGDFMDEIQPLADWKIKKGIPCSVVDVDEIGDKDAIKQFIQLAYDIGDLTFVLLVGDAAQVPPYTIYGDASDNSYSYVAGNDHYPDLFVGRFSAETGDQVTTMVERTLTYETDPISDTAWYSKAIGVASNQGPGDDGEMDYEHIRNIGNNKLIPFTYNYAYEFFDGSQGGEDAPGNPTPSMVGAAVDSGATIINYCGHGSTTSWGSSGFSNSNVNNLTNVGKWPFIISVACINGNFDGPTCFAEAWLRATDNGEPTGALATLMSTVIQGWNPPMCGQDAMNDILVETYEDNIKRTFGGITMNGCMEMNDIYGSDGTAETDYWTIFGDPSVVVRTAIPAEMTVSVADTLSVDDSTLTVTCDAEGALAVLSMNGEILAKGEVSDGEVTLEFDPVSEPDTADIVITAFNYRPFISTVEFVSIPSVFITYAGSSVNDTDGNDNGLLDYAEEVYLTVSLTNIGEVDAQDVSVELSSENPFVTIEVDSADYGQIAAGDTVAVEDAFHISIAEDIPDGEMIEFMITAEDQSERTIWESDFSVEAHAPVLSYQDFVIDDSSGDGNGKIDPGESADVTVTFANLGSSEAYNVYGQLSTESEYISVFDDQQMIGNLEAGESSQLVFQLTANGDTPEGTSATLAYDMIADHEISGNGEFYLVIGQIPVYVLNLANNTDAADSILMCLNNLQVGAEYGTHMAENFNIYKAVFITLGVSPDTGQLTTEQGKTLADFLNQGGNIYMEGGDTWASDEQTAVHEMFHIVGTDDGSDDLSTINGEQGGFLDGFTFVYNGPNNSIDRIDAGEGAVLLMSNENPDYGVAVSYMGENYNTIGASASFSGLQNDGGNTKDGVMAEILNFFGVGFTWTAISETTIQDNDIVAYPNPFKEKVNFMFTLNKRAKVSLDIYDMTGRKVSTLIDNELSEGSHTINWNGSNLDRMKLHAGIYFYNLRIGDQSVTKKLILAD